MNTSEAKNLRGLPSTHGRIVLLTLLYFAFGRLIFASDSQTSILSPLFFIPEGIALAFALLYGRTMAIGVFVGQLLLALSTGDNAWQAIGLGCTNGLEALLASLLAQGLKLDVRLQKQRDFWILTGLIIFILQPFSATASILILNKFASNSTAGEASIQVQWIYRWLSNAIPQTQLTPFLLFLLPAPRKFLNRSNLIWIAKAFPPLIIILAINFHWNLNSQSTALGFIPILMLTPLTVAVALRTNNFGLFCLYTSAMAFSISYLIPFQVGNYIVKAEEIPRVEFRVFVVLGISQAVNLATVQLLTARDLATQRAQQLAQQLKISLMAASLTHEVKQPIAAIQLASQQLLTVSDRDRNKLIQSVMQSANELSASTAKVHNLLRSLPVGLEILDLSRTVELALLQAKIKLKQAQVSLQLRGLNSPCMINGDSSQISLALANLVRNSIHELSKLPEDQHRLITVNLTTSPASADLSIGDNGPGFPAQDWEPTLFETSKSDGTGLGLYLVKQMADNHKAHLLFGRSSMGGAEVTIRFPRRVPYPEINAS